jgi:hypothetical protein
VLKWTGRLTALSYRPLAGAIVVVFVLTVLARGLHWTREAREESPLVVERQRAKADLDERLRSLVLIPAIRRAARLRFRLPHLDPLQITDAPGLATKIGDSARIQTDSYRRVLVHIRREGGSTIGLSGPRGVGKTELIHAFCGQGRASIAEGGAIGAVLAAPTPYEPVAFLRQLLLKVCAGVPGYDERALARPLDGHPRRRRLTALAGLLCSAAGLVLLAADRITLQSPQLGWVLLLLGLLVIGSSAFGSRFRDTVRAFARQRLSKKGEDSARVEQRRREFARTAVDTARRVQFAETQTASTQGSLGWRGLGASLTTGLSLSRLPLTEADLIEEMRRLVSGLQEVG